MSFYEDNAIEYFRSNFNCAQAVLVAFSEKYNMDKETALKISSGLGAGFRAGEICGAVSGAVLVIGLRYGQSNSLDMESKHNCYMKTEEFIRIFRERYNGVQCRELLGCDLSTKEGREKAEKEELFKNICEDNVRNAVKLLEELGY
jgi:C_GCAxxG_C_C family probable redox protein